MSAMKQNCFQIRIRLCLFLALLFTCLGFAVNTSRAAASLYENDATVTDPSPIPDATNFLNTGTFEVTFPGDVIYKTHDTLNFTNTGYMSAGFDIQGIVVSGQLEGELISESSIGYQFDDFSTTANQDYEAASFDNENTIECAEQCIVWATNVANPGWIFVDNNSGLIQFTGNNLDLSDTFCYIAGGLGNGGISLSPEDYGVGIDTKGEWVPSADLLANEAQSSFFTSVLDAIPPNSDQLFLGDSTSYFDTEIDSTNSTVYRAAFVQDLNPQTPYNVYFGGVSFGNGLITVGWSGIYTNIATGQLQTNYLYLNDEPELISSNGVNIVNVIGGVPDNYTFAGSSTPLVALAPATAGYSDVFNAGKVTNNYSYTEVQFISTTVPTNSLVFTNVSAIAGRVMINSAQELNLSQAVIGGENYIKLNCTNEFDGNGGSAISAAYADIALGVTNGPSITNGILVVSNILQSEIPVYSGTIQAWSTRWQSTYSNTVITATATNTFTATNDYRVELVNSDVFPTTPSQVQNLSLYATNSVTLSDNMNVFGSVYINAQNLTLTTNGVGNGAYSEEGTLNLANPNILWPSSFPNLHWLTNNGAISVGNLAYFGSSAPFYTTNSLVSSNAVGLLTEGKGSNIAAKSTVTIGTNVYAFFSKLTNGVPNQVLIGKNFSGSLSNLIAAINAGKGAGTNYSSSTRSNVLASASRLATNEVLVTAILPGAGGDAIKTLTTATNLTWNGITNLVGGVNASGGVTNLVGGVSGFTNIVTSFPGVYGAFVNNGSVSDEGSQISANYFENSGIFDNGAGSFNLSCETAVLTNGELLTYEPLPPYFTNGYNGNISITADSLTVSNATVAAGGGLIFEVTNSLSDTIPPFQPLAPGITNGNLFYSQGGTLVGLDMPIKPASGDLLGTTIYLLTPPPNKSVKDTWAGLNFGASPNGYSDNEAIGQLILDVTTPNGSMNFTGVATNGTTNAIYVDKLELLDYASYANGEGNQAIPTLNFNTNLVIYYADAVASSSTSGGTLTDVSYLLNNSNKGHLVWVPQYIGYFSSTNIVYSNGTTNTLNIGLVSSPFLDSNGNGIPNNQDPNPLFVSSEINFMQISNELIWDSIPSATNTVLSSPDMSTWTIYTNFVSPSTPLPADEWPITNTLIVPASNFYRVGVTPDNSDTYGD
jgi:hypothetical protein